MVAKFQLLSVQGIIQTTLGVKSFMCTNTHTHMYSKINVTINIVFYPVIKFLDLVIMVNNSNKNPAYPIIN